MSETEQPMSPTPDQPAAGEPRAGSKTLRVTVVVVIIVVVVFGAYLANRYWIKPAVAKPSVLSAHPTAPAFTLPGAFGGELSLSQYRGKVVLLDFFATWCGPCRMEIPGLIELQKRYGGQGLQVVGVLTQDQPGNVPGFYKQFGMNYPVAIGSQKVEGFYGGIFGLPTTFLIGRDGRIYVKVEGGVGGDYFEPAIKALLAAPPGEEVKNFQPMQGSEKAEVETPAEANSPVPGIDVSKLTKAQLARYEDAVSKQQCTCGCNVSVLVCRQTDPGCDVSRQLAQKILAEIK